MAKLPLWLTADPFHWNRP